MALITLLDLERNYVDRGTQTDVFGMNIYLQQYPEGKVSDSGVDKAVNVDQYLDDNSDRAVSHDLVELDPAYSHTLSTNSPGPGPVSVSGVRRVSRRAHRYARLGHTRGKASDTLRKSSNRVISMPETTPLYSIKNILESTKNLRIASMSERPKPDMFAQDANSLDGFEVSASTENSYLTADEGPHCNKRPGSQANDLPCTPSPPSSPDSIMIIENSVHLPLSFLRRNPKTKSQATFGDNDEGWITWASSPPRPIPALHGPLSLPYARCPSGAEGTVIEGPNDLSRMIWGLGTDDTQPSHARVAPHTPHKSMANLTHSKISPRLPKVRKHSSQGHPTQSRGRSAEAAPPPVLSAGDQDQMSQATVHKRAFERLGRYPTDQQCNEPRQVGMAQAGNIRATQKRDPVCYSHDRWTKESFDSDWRVFDMERGLGLDWQSTYTRRDSQISGSLSGDKQFADYLKASTPAFVPGNITTGLPYPRIFVEPRPNELTRISQRPSALEIAHKYRQQQQLQNTLPTPPRSSSTQWSPYFASYQDTLSSPDLVTSLPSRISKVQTQQHYSTSDPSQQLRRFIHERMGDDIGLVPKTNSFESPLQVDFPASPRSSMQHSPDVSVSLAKFLQHRNAVLSPSVMTPPHPGPPPNTPLPPVPKYKFSSTSSPSFATPPSPTSPETRSRSVSYQQPRSIPLARLIQRRLSSVPEEEMGAFADRTRSPSPSHDNSFSRLQAQALIGWEPHPVGTRPSVRTPSPVSVSLAPQTRPSDIMTTKKSANASVKVKLPNPPRMNNPTVLGDVNGQRVATGHQKKKMKGKKIKQQFIPAEMVVNN